MAKESTVLHKDLKIITEGVNLLKVVPNFFLPVVLLVPRKDDLADFVGT
jgi:hypothetical protein